jgi:hypothetical protein
MLEYPFPVLFFIRRGGLHGTTLSLHACALTGLPVAFLNVRWLVNRISYTNNLITMMIVYRETKGKITAGAVPGLSLTD